MAEPRPPAVTRAAVSPLSPLSPVSPPRVPPEAVGVPVGVQRLQVLPVVDALAAARTHRQVAPWGTGLSPCRCHPAAVPSPGTATPRARSSGCPRRPPLCPRGPKPPTPSSRSMDRSIPGLRNGDKVTVLTSPARGDVGTGQSTAQGLTSATRTWPNSPSLGQGAGWDTAPWSPPPEAMPGGPAHVPGVLGGTRGWWCRGHMGTSGHRPHGAGRASGTWRGTGRRGRGTKGSRSRGGGVGQAGDAGGAGGVTLGWGDPGGMRGSPQGTLGGMGTQGVRGWLVQGDGGGFGQQRGAGRKGWGDVGVPSGQGDVGRLGGPAGRSCGTDVWGAQSGDRGGA